MGTWASWSVSLLFQQCNWGNYSERFPTPYFSYKDGFELVVEFSALLLLIGGKDIWSLYLKQAFTSVVMLLGKTKQKTEISGDVDSPY